MLANSIAIGMMSAVGLNDHPPHSDPPPLPGGGATDITAEDGTVLTTEGGQTLTTES